MVALAAPLLETINPASLTNNLANVASSPLNSTALVEADALAAQTLSLAGSHVSILSSPRHVKPPSSI